MDLIAVAAVAENGVIGADGELPWSSIPADKRQYRERVASAPVVLGRRTFESMRGDLPGSHQFVLSRDSDLEYQEPAAQVVNSVEAAIERLREHGHGEAFVLGGGGAYAATFPYLTKLRISRIPGEYAGDTTFPAIDPGEWRLVRREDREGFELEIWHRRGTRTDDLDPA